jgi:hypothetical protein
LHDYASVRVAYDYYPFGLTWQNPADFHTPEGIHDHAYQDKEYQWNEFGSGAGLALYDFHARMYDPGAATWSVPDPADPYEREARPSAQGHILLSGLFQQESKIYPRMALNGSPETNPGF